MAISQAALASVWSDSDLTRLSLHITNWKSIAPVLFITEAEENEIEEDNSHDYRMQKFAMLRKWKAKAGDGATYGQLIRVFSSIREMVLVEHIQEILLHPEEPATATAMYLLVIKSSYRDHTAKHHIHLYFLTSGQL